MFNKQFTELAKELDKLIREVEPQTDGLFLYIDEFDFDKYIACIVETIPYEGPYYFSHESSEVSFEDAMRKLKTRLLNEKK